MLRMPRDAASTEDAGQPLSELTEARLIGRVATGELQAFEQLYHTYHPRLTRFLDRVTRRPGLVGELLNDTMLVVWNRAASYNGHCKVSTWVFAIAYRKAMKALARWDEPVEDDGSDDCVPPETGPEQRLAQAQLRARLLRDNEARLVYGPTTTDAYLLAVPPERVRAVVTRLRAQNVVLLVEALDGSAAP
jgi:RNA polymerase sigma-70 factor (ECF subfamily)